MAGGWRNFDINTRELVAASQRYAALGPELRKVQVRTVNWVGARARTATVRQLADKMGLPQRELRNFLQTFTANSTTISYTIRGTGRPISLRAFGAIQRNKGVSARPWGERRLFRGTFIVDSLGGSVYVRTGEMARMTKGASKGKMRERIKKLWGPAVPREMTQHIVVSAFTETVKKHYAPRLDHEIQRALAKLRT